MCIRDRGKSLYFQDVIKTLQDFWIEQDCYIGQPYDIEKEMCIRDRPEICGATLGLDRKDDRTILPFQTDLHLQFVQSRRKSDLLYQSEGIVLDQNDLGEFDKLATIFTRQEGLVKAVVKGAGRPKSKLRGLTQPFTYALFQFFRGRAFDRVTQVSVKHSYPRIMDDYDKMIYARYIAELLIAVLPEKARDQNQFVFLLAVLNCLEHKEDPWVVARWAELGILSLAGFAPSFAGCISCGEGHPDPPVYFSLRDGGAICSGCLKMCIRDSLLEAPGTYHHSIMVGNLAEAAAWAIGADSLLTRVGAYYHDIGKIKRPYLFAENQVFGMENPHEKMNPSLSATVIMSHVKDGVELAEEHKVPQVILNFIREHHGTTLASFFYMKASENAAARDDRAPEELSLIHISSPFLTMNSSRRIFTGSTEAIACLIFLSVSSLLRVRFGLRFFPMKAESILAT